MGAPRSAPDPHGPEPAAGAWKEGPAVSACGRRAQHRAAATPPPRGLTSSSWCGGALPPAAAGHSGQHSATAPGSRHPTPSPPCSTGQRLRGCSRLRPPAPALGSARSPQAMEQGKSPSAPGASQGERAGRGELRTPGRCRPRCGAGGTGQDLPAPEPPLPAVLDVFVNEAGDQHGDQRVVPGADEHQRQAQAHAQEREGPAEGTALSEPRSMGLGLALCPPPTRLTSGSSGSVAASWVSAAASAPRRPG